MAVLSNQSGHRATYLLEDAAGVKELYVRSDSARTS
jgi:hypothetical protein